MENRPDWQQIAASLEDLGQSRRAVRELCLRELDNIEAAIHHVNKKLDGFTFRLESYPEEGDVVHVARIDLFGEGEEDPYPWSYRLTLAYSGNLDGFFAREGYSETDLEATDRTRAPMGSRQAQWWEQVLSGIALLNLRDTPRQAKLD